jgi:dipeptidyl aminopeptidase/acylaminoacyl peptidase
MRRVLFVLLIGSTVQSGPPDTEVFLAPFSVSGAKVVVGTPLNISNNPGYDNQPCFTPDGGSVLFTSVRGGRKPDPANSAASGSDIYRYDVASRQVTQVTDTPESEYSPTVTPDGRHISVIRVEADGTQRLWRFTLDGKNPELVLRDVKPVGYHAWANASTLALFVLGQPATLQVASVDTGQAVVAAKGIGRSIQRIPGAGISYVSRETTAEGKPPLLTVHELDASTRESRPLVEVPQGAADADTAWTPDGMLLVPVQGKLFGWRRGDRAFTEVADLESLGLRSVTRLSLSPKGDRIAIVAQPRN